MEKLESFSEKEYDGYLNKNIYNLIFNDNQKNKRKNSEVFNYILKYIEHFTLGENDRIKFEEMFDTKFNSKIIKYSKFRKKYYLKIKALKINFNLLSDYFKEEPYVEELKKLDRYHKCHLRCFELLEIIENSKLVSGIMDVFNEDIYHSVLEITDEKGNIYYVDYVKNLIMKKEDYIFLTNFKELQSISYDEFENDLEILSKIFDKIEMKWYFAFRYEIMRDLYKNSKILTFK